MSAVFILVAASTGMSATPPRRTGEAVVAAQVGKVQTRIFVGPVHEGRTELRSLSAGASIGESSRIISGDDGRACLVLSPGAILCVAPQTELTFTQLRHTADGLPKREEDIVRRIHINLHRGRIQVHAAPPSPTLEIRVGVDAGGIEASGGTFVVAGIGPGEWAVINEAHGNGVVPAQAARIEVPAGAAFRLVLKDDGKGSCEQDDLLLKAPERQFEICNCFFDDLEHYIRDPGQFDRAGLTRYMGEMGGGAFISEADTVLDVSPSVRWPSKNETERPSLTGEAGAGGRWDPVRIRRWYDQLGVVKGVNYVPRYAVNSVETWMDESFDPEMIGEELDWARDAGYTTLRVQLQYVVWEADPDGFLKRVDAFLDLASRRGLKVALVLFDDRNYALSDPVAGPQLGPQAGVFNSRWVPSPGAAAADDRAVWPSLEKYAKAVMNQFKRDSRVVFWDLYNRAGDHARWEASLPLLEQAFIWARQVDPDQPVTVPAWALPGSAMTARKLERSDFITFQSFQSAREVEALLLILRRYDRPIICTDWLMRQHGNTFEEILPVFSAHRVGWFNRGLVNGRTQEWIQQPEHRSQENPDVWQHDVLRTDGEAYDDAEIKLIREFHFQDRF